MRNILILIAICSLLLTGCSGLESTSTSTIQPGTGESASIQSTASTFTTETATTPTSESTAPQGPINITLYLPNEAWDGFIEREVTIEALQPDLIIQHLAEHGAITMDAKVLSVVQIGSQLHLDMDEAFLLQLYSMGTTGEKMLVGCLVNTFLSAYDCETLMLTAEGDTIHSGHLDYDFPLGPYV